MISWFSRQRHFQAEKRFLPLYPFLLLLQTAKNNKAYESSLVNGPFSMNISLTTRRIQIPFSIKLPMITYLGPSTSSLVTYASVKSMNIICRACGWWIFCQYRFPFGLRSRLHSFVLLIFFPKVSCPVHSNKICRFYSFSLCILYLIFFFCILYLIV